MNRSWFAASAASALFLLGASGSVLAEDAKAVAILDKAVKALGGEEKLSKIRAASWKSEGKVIVNGTDNKFSTGVTFQGDDHLRLDFEGDFSGSTVQGTTVLAGDKGWRKLNENQQELDENDVKREKRRLYLILAPNLPNRLKANGFTVTVDGEEKVGDKPADVLKIVGPDGKDFRLFIDRESSLPVQSIAQVSGWNGEDFEQTTTFSDYKDFGGVKRPGKIASTRNGELLSEQTVVEFKILDEVPAETFAEPK